jgi:hypothetical protein
MPLRKSSKDKEILAEPWGPSSIFVDRTLDEELVYVSAWKPKQIRFLSQVNSLVVTTEKYLGFDVPWLKELIFEYMKLSKFEDGWIIKQAKDVARGSSTRMLFNVARWKRILYGEEPEPTE